MDISASRDFGPGDFLPRRGNMRRALPVSAVLHVALLLAAVWLAHGGRPDDSVALESIAVSIISIQSAADSTTRTPSDATETLVAAGTVAATDPDPIDTPAPETIKPVGSESMTASPPTDPPPAPVEKLTAATSDQPAAAVLTAIAPTTVDAISPAPVAAEAVAPVTPPALPATPTTAATSAVAAATPEPIEPAPLSPATVATRADAIQPVETHVTPPTPVAIRTPAAARPTPERSDPAKPKSRPAANAGAGGRARASAEAAPAFRGGTGAVDDGGSAAETRYPGTVLAQLRRALRRPASGGFGEVKVGFTVLAGGGVTAIGIVASSGSAALDQAATDTVRRAAPFPPIPPAAHRTSWRFVMPLTFR